MKLARVILIGVFAIYLLLKKEFRNNNYILCMGVFCLIAISSTNWAINKVYANAMGKTLLINLVCMYALFFIVDRKKERIEEVLKALVVAPLFLELRVIVTGGIFAFSSSRKTGNINGNTVGVCAAFAICFAIYFKRLQSAMVSHDGNSKSYCCYIVIVEKSNFMLFDTISNDLCV